MVRLSPSSADRWRACPGSLRFEPEQRGLDANIYTAAGTLAHTIAAAMLSGESTSLTEYVGTSHTVEGIDVTVDSEMIDAIRFYLNYLESSHLDTLHVEMKIASDVVLGLEGTTDFAGWSYIDGLHVVDYKHGIGVTVEADDNEQLKAYSVLCCEQFGFQDTTVTIVQPRSWREDPIRTARFTKAENLEHQQTLVDFAVGPHDTFQAGDHCAWCPGRTDCPLLRSMSAQVRETDMRQIDMTPELAASFLAREDAIKTFLKQVYAYSCKQAEKGIVIPGYKLVNKRGNRAYNRTDDYIADACSKAGFTDQQIREPAKLKSPAQLEKVVGKDIVKTVVHRPERGTKLVPVTDERPEAERLTTADAFADVEVDFENQ